MKRIALVAGPLALMSVAIIAASVISAPKLGARKTFAELHDSRIGSMYVLGSYGGLLNGWDVSLLHHDNHTNWFGYYLAHESYGWGKASLRFDGRIAVVTKGNKLVARYDAQNGRFTHTLQGMVYSKDDAAVDERRAVFWNLADIQRKE